MVSDRRKPRVNQPQMAVNGSGNQVFQAGGNVRIDVNRKAGPIDAFSAVFGERRPAKQAPEPPLQRLLFLSANPTSRYLKLDRDVAVIEQVFARAGVNRPMNVVQRWALTPFELRQALLEYSPQLVHFSGHGAQQGLLLQDDSGKGQLIGGAQLASLFELFKESISCVVLCACHTKVQAQAVAEHIQYVVGMNAGIKDALAQAFCGGFYQGVAGGLTYKDAFKLGLNAIAMEAIAQQDVPVLYCHGKPVVDP